MLNKNAQALVDALRSGDYQQTTGTLRDDTGHCCLGVGCDISGLGTWKEQPERGAYAYETAVDTDSGLLPADVRTWLGFRSVDGRFKSPVPIEGQTHSSLSGRNDAGLTFAEIADIIESEPEGLFA